MPEIPGLLDSLFVSEPLRSIFADRARLQAMLEVESALALAQAELGLIPDSAARFIEAACDADLFSVAELSAATAHAGNVAIPLIKALTAEVERRNAPAARYVHWGATSQDVIGTPARPRGSGPSAGRSWRWDWSRSRRPIATPAPTSRTTSGSRSSDSASGTT